MSKPRETFVFATENAEFAYIEAEFAESNADWLNEPLPEAFAASNAALAL